MNDNRYFKQVELMIRILPHVANESCFALKGGTAINLFIRDMPRLSVDIDLTYLPIESHEVSFLAISEALERIANTCQKFIPQINIHKNYSKNTSNVNKLFIKQADALVKIETNEVIRGSVFPIVQRDLVKIAEEKFGLFTSIATLSLADIYGGKICAALDRQHPRDLFDVKLLLENEGITEDIRKAFIIYLISHDRPISKLIRPNLKDFKQTYENEFVDMSSFPVSYEELIDARRLLIDNINSSLTVQDKQFIVSVKEGQPKWDLIEVLGVEQLPAVRWKLMNINRMDKMKHSAALNELKAKLLI